MDGGPELFAILDDKTDRVTSDAEIGAKQEHYAPQLSAYTRALQQFTGRTSSATGLIFARPGPNTR